MRILICDDNTLLREGIKSILSDAPEITSVGEAEDAGQVLELVEKSKWDVILLDINLRGRSSLEVLKELKERFPRLPVLVLSMYTEGEYAVRAIRAGAAGYITKAVVSRQLIEAIRKVARGGVYISETVAEKLAGAVGLDQDRPLHEKLSDREFEVFKALASAKTVSEIADQLSLSVKTVSTYRTQILMKMGMQNNAQIMQYAVKHQLLD